MSQQPLAAPSDALAKPKRLTRRRFVRGAAAGMAATFLYTWRFEPHWVEIVRQSLPIAGLPQALVGKRLVQLSDLHAGPVDQTFLTRSLEGVAKLQPDMLAITGDFMSGRGAENVPQALDAIRALPSAPLGRLAILGNHDYGLRWRRDDVADKLVDGLESLGVQVLRNEMAEVAGLQVAGVDDFWTPHFDLTRTLDQFDSSRPAIALCHNPDGVDQPGWKDFRGWILSGHTHGGQCKPPFLPPPLTPVRNKRYVAGKYDLAGGRQLYINRGLGYIRRVRFNCRPEITVFTLEQA